MHGIEPGYYLFIGLQNGLVPWTWAAYNWITLSWAIYYGRV